MPARRGAWAIYQVFGTADGEQLFIGVTSDPQWRRFVAEFGLDDLGNDPRLATNGMRVKEREWLIPALEAVIATMPTQEAKERCERANISWAPVGKPADLFTDPHLLASAGLVDVFMARAGQTEDVTVKLPALPVEFGWPRQRPGLSSQPPRIGEQSRTILAQAGVTPSEIDALIERKVVIATD